MSRTSFVLGPSTLALALLRRGRGDKAKAELARALAIDPSIAVAHFNLGLVRMMQHDNASAREHLKRVVVLEGSKSLEEIIALLKARVAAIPQ